MTLLLPSRFELLWEALHPEPDSFGGCLFDSRVDEAFLFYPGALQRTGLLAWQKVRLKEPAEVQCVAYREDAVRWSVEIGEGIDFGRLTPDEVYRAMQIRGLGAGPGVVLAALTFATDRWLLLAVSREERRVLWTREVREPQAAHVSADGTSIVAALADGRVVLLRSRDGSEAAELCRGVDQAEAVAGPSALAVLDPEEVLRVYGLDGAERWRCGIAFIETEALTSRVAIGQGDVLVAEPGSIRRFDASSGTERWRAEGPPGSQLVVSDLGYAVVVQDLGRGDARLYLRATGERLDSETFDRMRHFAPMGDRLVGDTAEGQLIVLDLATREAVIDRSLEGLRLWEVQAAAGRLFATAVTSQEEPLLLVELDPSDGGLLGGDRLPEPGPFTLEPLSDGRVALTGHSGALVYEVREARASS